MRWSACSAVVAAVLALACGGSPSLPVVEPTPEPPAVSAEPTGCGLPPGGPFQHCPRELPFFAEKVNEAIGLVQHHNPELFDFRDGLGGMSYRVTDRERYHAEVVRQLEGLGFCALWDGEEVGLKNTNAFNEQYQVMTSMGYVRWGGGAYRSTCYPAWF